MPGDSTVAYANYASVVKSIYDAAWTLPDTIAKDENVTVKVTIASDGTVISSRIIERSGDAPVDASVQRALDRVTFVAPFPEGSSDKQRTYTINFNPQSQKFRMKNCLKICLPILLVGLRRQFCSRPGRSKPDQIPDKATRFGHEAHPRLARRFQRRGRGRFEIRPLRPGLQLRHAGRRAISNQRQQFRQRHRQRDRQAGEEGAFFRAPTPARRRGGRRTPLPTTSFLPSPAKKASA